MGFSKDTIVSKNSGETGFICDFEDSYELNESKVVELLFGESVSRFDIRCTLDQEFLNAKNEFVKAGDLHEGMQLKLGSGLISLSNILNLSKESEVYTLRDTDTFKVNGLIVKGEL